MEEKLYEMFDPMGRDHVTDVRIQEGLRGNENRGFCFVDMVRNMETLELTTQLENRAASGELLIYNRQIGLEIRETAAPMAPVCLRIKFISCLIWCEALSVRARINVSVNARLICHFFVSIEHSVFDKVLFEKVLSKDQSFTNKLQFHAAVSCSYFQKV